MRNVLGQTEENAESKRRTLRVIRISEVVSQTPTGESIFSETPRCIRVREGLVNVNRMTVSPSGLSKDES